MPNVWSQEEKDYWLGEKRNWGRWGEDDQVGTVNLIDDERRLAAAGVVRHGRSISLSYPIQKTPTADALFPALHSVKVMEDNHIAFDYFQMAMHTAGTHIDALNHAWDKHGLYNGRQLSDVYHNSEINWCDVDVWGDKGIVTRGVVLDVVKHRGTHVTDGEPVTNDELEAIVRAQGVEVHPGDALIIHCGRDGYVEEHGQIYRFADDVEPGRPAAEYVINPGLEISCLKFIRESDCSVLVWDMVECQPHGEEGLVYSVHSAIWAYGLALVDNCSLGKLAQACAELNQYECMLVVAPLRIEGATGSQVNPLAIL